jgi:hypothetical protein
MSESQTSFPFAITKNSKVALTLGSVFGLSGALLYAGWMANDLLRDIKDELRALRTDVRAVSQDRWTGRDMRDYGVELKDLNATVSRAAGQSGLVIPDVRRIQRGNHTESEP